MPPPSARRASTAELRRLQLAQPERRLTSPAASRRSRSARRRSSAASAASRFACSASKFGSAFATCSRASRSRASCFAAAAAPSRESSAFRAHERSSAARPFPASSTQVFGQLLERNSSAPSQQSHTPSLTRDEKIVVGAPGRLAQRKSVSGQAPVSGSSERSASQSQ